MLRAGSEILKENVCGKLLGTQIGKSKIEYVLKSSVLVKLKKQL